MKFNRKIRRNIYRENERKQAKVHTDRAHSAEEQRRSLRVQARALPTVPRGPGFSTFTFSAQDVSSYHQVVHPVFEEQIRRSGTVDYITLQEPGGRARSRLQVTLSSKKNCTGTAFSVTRQTSLDIHQWAVTLLQHKLTCICCRCNKPVATHTVTDILGNAYGLGSALSVHRDTDEGPSISFVAPGCVFHGGKFLLANKPNFIQRRIDNERTFANRNRDTTTLPLSKPFDAVFFDGSNYYHEVTRVKKGTRYSILIGFENCTPS